MNRLLALLALCAALVGVAVPAKAQSLSILSGGCGTASYVNGTPYLTVDASGRLCGYGIGYVGGYNSGPKVATATPANSSHAAGVSVGGLFTVAAARTNGGSGTLTGILWKSTGGSTGQIVIRIWQKNPASTTCTDNSAFAGNDTDDANLITAPFTLSPAAPASTTGDANTYASLSGVSWDYVNGDTSPGTSLYVCAVTVATDTADQNKLVRVSLSGPQN